MATEKQITKKDLMDALHEFWQQVIEPVMATKEDISGLKGEIISVRERIQEVRLELKGEIRENRRQISEIKSDLVTRKEFDALKEKVDRFHPSN